MTRSRVSFRLLPLPRPFRMITPSALRRSHTIARLAFAIVASAVLVCMAAAQTPLKPYATPNAGGAARHNAVAAASGTPQAAVPQFSVAPGIYSGTQTVSITDTTPGATIYYTTNGAYPNAYSTKFSSPITVSSSEVVVAYAAASGYLDSASGSARYLISSSSTPFIYSLAGNGLAGYSGDGGLAVQAQLNAPYASTVDAAGNLYIADYGSNVVRKVNATTGIITTIAGTGTSGHTGDNGPASSAELSNISSIAVDGSGNVYIGEQLLCDVRKVDSNGVITTYAGNGTCGLGGNNGNNGPAASAVLYPIYGLTLDAAGDLYIATYYDIRKVTASTGTITTVTGDGNIFGSAANGGPATQAGLSGITGIALDSMGNLYFSESINDDVRMVNGQTGILSLFAGGSSNRSGGDGGPASSAGLYWPTALATDGSNNLYIDDWFDSAIRKVNLQTGIITTIAGNWSSGASVGGDGDPATSVSLGYPQSISSDKVGNLYVCWGERVYKVTAPMAPPTPITASPTFSVAAGTYANGQTLSISSPTSGSNLYVSFGSNPPDTNFGGYYGPMDISGTATVNVVAVAPGQLPSAPVSATYTITAPPAKVITTTAGSGIFGFTGSGGPALNAEFGAPAAIVMDASGNQYILDQYNGAVWKITAGSGTITLIAGTGTSGYQGDGGPATSAEFSYPSSIAVDGAGNLYISDTNNNRIRMVSAATQVVSTIAGPGTQGNLGDGGPATSALISAPMGMVIHGGSLYFADQFNARVRAINLTTGIISTVAGGGHSSGDGEVATDAALKQPEQVTFDSSGNLYLFDRGSLLLRMVAAGTGDISTLAGNGLFGSPTPGGPATDSALGPVQGLAVDAAGNVYFSDYPNNVLKIDAKTKVLSNFAGNGYAGFSGDGGDALMAGLSAPQGLAFDTSGNLYIADFGNFRIREVSTPIATATPTFSVASGAYTGTQNISITDATANATIYYTTDGSTPDTGSTKYSGPITVGNTETIQAIAVASGYAQSAVASAAYTITIPTPSIGLTASANPIFTSNPVTFTATLSSTYGTPTGTVNFLDGTTQLGSGTLSGGVATYTTSSLAAGSHSITAVYGGDTNFKAATSTAVAETVEDFTFAPPSGGSTSATASPGGTATYTLSVTPPSGGSSAAAITFSISGLPTGATATFTPTSVPAGAGPTNVTLTIQLPASAAATPGELRAFGDAPLALGFLLLPLLGGRRFRRSLAGKATVVAFALLALGALGGVTGCGGGSSGSTSSQPQNYTLTVTATAGTLSHTTTLTLTVE